MFGKWFQKKITDIMHSQSGNSSGRKIQDPDLTPELDGSLSAEDKANFILEQLTLQEKVNMLGGEETLGISGVSRLKIPRVWTSDASAGVRCFRKATSFPVPLAMAATWNHDLMGEIGTAIGEECRAKGVSVLLGPGINLYRVPTCGRNFEYMGEDPCLISELVVPYIHGVQSRGVITTVKHFACNNSDYDRHRMNSHVDERTLRELYLPGFKAAIIKGNSRSIMTSYNPVNGIYASENKVLLHDILREEWGFNGFVMSDWVSVYHTKEPLLAGLDLEMPKARYLTLKKIRRLIDAGELDEIIIDGHVKNLLRVFFEMGVYDRPIKDSRYAEFSQEHFQIALKTAQEAIILLKNQGNLLPLDKDTLKKVVILGRNALRTTVSGGGSCYLRTDETVDIFTGIQHTLLDATALLYLPITSEKITPEDTKLLRTADVVLYCAGFTEVEESEVWDRSWSLVENEGRIIKHVSALNPKTIVIITAGGGLETESWIHSVPAVLHSLYLGQSVGTAISEVIFGIINPSGKLPFTMAKQWADFASTKNYVQHPEKMNPLRAWGPPGINGIRKIWTVDYQEGLMVGYRHFDTNQVAPQFPFGFGLSYTQFTLAGLSLSTKEMTREESIIIKLHITNTGKRPGAEVVQLYLRDIESSLFRPIKELKAFNKIFLEPGDTKEIQFVITESHLQFFDPTSHRWVSESGFFEVLIGTSSRNISLKERFELKET